MWGCSNLAGCHAWLELWAPVIRGGVFTWIMGEVGSGMNRGKNSPVLMYITICHNSHHSLTHQAGKGLQHVREHLAKQTYKVHTFKVSQQHAA